MESNKVVQSPPAKDRAKSQSNAKEDGSDNNELAFAYSGNNHFGP
jgi:hypothetical protein